jgi:hypothetical protein
LNLPLFNGIFIALITSNIAYVKPAEARAHVQPAAE